MTFLGWPMRSVLLMAVLQAPLCFSVEAKLIWLPGPFDINAIKMHSGEEHVDRYVADSQTITSLYLVYRHGALDAKGSSVISFTIQGFRKNNEIEESLSFSQRILAGYQLFPPATLSIC